MCLWRYKILLKFSWNLKHHLFNTTYSNILVHRRLVQHKRVQHCTQSSSHYQHYSIRYWTTHCTIEGLFANFLNFMLFNLYSWIWSVIFVHSEQNKLQREIDKADQVSKTGFLSLLRRGMWDYMFVSFAKRRIQFCSPRLHITETDHKSQVVLFCALLYVGRCCLLERNYLLFLYTNQLFGNNLSSVWTCATKYASSLSLKWCTGSYIVLWFLAWWPIVFKHTIFCSVILCCALYFMPILLTWNSIVIGTAEMETKLLDSLSLVTHLQTVSDASMWIVIVVCWPVSSLCKTGKRICSTCRNRKFSDTNSVTFNCIYLFNWKHLMLMYAWCVYHSGYPVS